MRVEETILMVKDIFSKLECDIFELKTGWEMVDFCLFASAYLDFTFSTNGYTQVKSSIVEDDDGRHDDS